jgi:DNA-binding transcriptional MerR regulator
MENIEKLEKLYYSISEVAEMFQVNTSLIRFWEKEFPNHIRPKKNRNGKRMFTSRDVENIRQVFLLAKEKGYTLSGAKNFLNTNKKSINKETELLEILTKVRSFLENIKTELCKTDDSTKTE